jgi:AraC-like DNA-binding protein
MILDLISFSVSLLCLLTFIMIIGSFKYNKSINIPFVIIILFVGIQRFQSSMSNLELLEFKSPFEEFPFFALFFIPIFLFFFKESIHKKRTSLRDLSHLLAPLILILLKKVDLIPNQISRVVFFLYSLLYWVIILLEIIKYYKSTLMKYSFNAISFRWLILIFFNLSLIMFFVNYMVVYWDLNKSDISLSNFYRGSSVLWAIALVYLFYNPIIIYGRNYLLNQLSIRGRLYNPWSYKSLIKLDTKELGLYKKIKRIIPELMYKTKILEKDIGFLETKDKDLKLLSSKLNIPNTHLKVLFKYHCRLSLHEYFNMLKIFYSIELIRQGFLKDQTIDSLSNKCFFDSRITFYNNFKKFTGISPSEFI